jgi:aspartyl-tRNA(Asn)/glutamyl-tRNA(Gln) amidotransferase subunit A
VSAKQELEASRNSIKEVFSDIDILLTPTVPTPPPLISDLKQHPETLRAQELLMLRNTRPFNVWGIPTISVPCGFTKEGLPIGLQLAAAPWNGVKMLQAAYAYEQLAGWQKRRLDLAKIS